MNDDSKLGAAILGLYAAIKICKAEGFDWKQVGEVVEDWAVEGNWPDE